MIGNEVSDITVLSPLRFLQYVRKLAGNKNLRRKLVVEKKKKVIEKQEEFAKIYLMASEENFMCPEYGKV